MALTPVKLLLALLSCTAVLLLSGCATVDDSDSELPWNTRQGWEGTPTIPGFSAQD
jgi:hypothetical protein